ncbi:MAG: hypothetical protein PVJ52_01485 [Candidatus Woesebacteria bacterium]
MFKKTKSSRRKRVEFKLPKKLIQKKSTSRKRKISKIKDERKKSKNFFASVFIASALWMAVGYIIYFVDPFTFGALPLFLLLVFLSLSLTLSIIFVNTRRGVIASAGITLFLLLRYFGVGNVVNFLLILGLSISAELYFSNS